MLDEAIRTVHPDVIEIPPTTSFKDALIYINSKGEKKETDKIKIAHQVTSVPPNLDILDLKKMINKTVMFIRNANGI
jgi:hypothetical protein